MNLRKILESPISDLNSDGDVEIYRELPGEDLGRYTLDALTKFSKKADPEYKKKLRAEIEKRRSGGLAYRDLPKKLKDAIVGKVTEHDDGSISVDGHTRWFDEDLTEIPIKFRRVTGDFWCFENKLTSLENAPDWVGGDFLCQGNRLTSLKCAPRYTGGAFWCTYNKLTSLDSLGEVKGEIYCQHNPFPEEQLIADYQRKRAKKDLALESLAVERILS